MDNEWVERERAQSLFSSTTPMQPSRVWQHLGVLVNGWCIAARGWRGLNPFIFVQSLADGWSVEVLCVGNGHVILMEKAPAKILGRGVPQMLLLSRRNQYRLYIGMHSYLVS